jgi:hypothetical protein
VAIDDAVATVALDQAAKRFNHYGEGCQPMRADRAGELLELRCEERLACEIRTMNAVDETLEERRHRSGEARRERDRRRKRLERASKSKRRETEPPPLPITPPWLALGISRATWYRRGKPAAPAEIGETTPRPPSNKDDVGVDGPPSQPNTIPPALFLVTPRSRLP